MKITTNLPLQRKLVKEFFKKEKEMKKEIQIDGRVYTFKDYQKMNREKRLAMKAEAIDRCLEANQRRSEAWMVLSQPITENFLRSVEELKKQPRFQKRYRGRAADMKAEIQKLRQEKNRKLEECSKVFNENFTEPENPSEIERLFLEWEQEVETVWEKYERLLSHFDWYYMHSDDYSVWSHGQRQWDEIVRLKSQLLAEGNDEEKVVELFQKFCPWTSKASER